MSFPGSRTRSLVAFAQSLCESTTGLSRDGFTLKGGITVGHRACHRWARWWTRKGTGSLSEDCCYSSILNLFRVKTRVYSYNLYTTAFLSYPSQLTKKNLLPPKNIKKIKKYLGTTCHPWYQGSHLSKVFKRWGEHRTVEVEESTVWLRKLNSKSVVSDSKAKVSTAE